MCAQSTIYYTRFPGKVKGSGSKITYFFRRRGKLRLSGAKGAYIHNRKGEKAVLVPLCRTLILYLLIVLAIRLMGKRQVGEMQPSELVVTILVSAVAAVPMQDLDIPLIHGVIPVLTLIAAEVLISAVSLEHPAFRRLITGRPVPVIRDGHIDQRALRQLRLSLDDLFEDLRLNGVFDVRQVRFAQLETNGQLSLLLRDMDAPATPRALGQTVQDSGLFQVVVADGEVRTDALRALERDEQWLARVLAAHGARSPREVFLLCADHGGSTVFLKKEG